MFDALIPIPRHGLLLGGTPLPIQKAFTWRGVEIPEFHRAAWDRLTADLWGSFFSSGGVPMRIRLDANFRAPEWAGVEESLRKEAYELRNDGHEVSLHAPAWEGLIRGLMTLAQILEDAQETGSLPCFRVADWPRLASRGIHYDLAREMEYRPAYMKTVIQRLAYFKLNTFHLYLEGTYAYKSAPEITPSGAMTEADARELVEWARLLGITVIPQVPTLGHMDKLLHGPYEELREEPLNSYNLCPTHPRSRPFLAGLLHDVAEGFRSSLIHVGYDESHSGRCARCRTHGTAADLLAGHLNWLNDQVKALGARTMIYGDKFLSGVLFPRADAVNGGSMEEAQRALDRVSRDILITDWHYTAPWGGTFRFFREQGFEVHVATATNIYWHDSIPLHRGHHWIVETIEEAVRQGVTGGFNTNWEYYRGAFFENYWFFQALAAERFWTDRPHVYPTFGSRFCRRFWGLFRDDYSEVAGLMETIPVFRRSAFLDSPIVADQGPDQGRLDYEELADYLEKRIAEIRGTALRNRSALDMLDLPALIIRYMGVRKRGIHEARIACHRGETEGAVRAFRAIRGVGERIAGRLQEGYEKFGGAVEDRKRIRRHLEELDDLIASNGDMRLFQRLTTFSASALMNCPDDWGGLALPVDLFVFPVPTVGQEGMADIRGVHGGKDGVVFVRAEVEFPHAFEGILLFGADGPVKVWVNGREAAWVPGATNPCVPDQYRALVSVREGKNEVVFAVGTNGGRAWGCCGRIIPACASSSKHLKGEHGVGGDEHGV